jgi:Asp-tRNA(Asn)/Glu-tRNA(Gln) amidotransferase A subunit family amidase
LGVPAISLPVLSDGGLPLGLQLIGKANRDAELIGLAHWFLSNGLRETSR